jgi:hypothetical protein
MKLNERKKLKFMNRKKHGKRKKHDFQAAPKDVP